MLSIYIVEDDENIRDLVTYALTGANFTALAFENSTGLFAQLQHTTPDCILLDIMLPGEDGLSILKKLRQSGKWQDVPVMMLTAKGSEVDKVKGLDLGADDYITKPFSVMELISRIHAVLRRSGKKQHKKLAFEGIEIDDEKHVVTANGVTVSLTLKEYHLLCYLVNHPEMVLSRDKIIENVWGYDFEGESRTIDMHIKTLRQKLGTCGQCIQTVRGIGYKIGKEQTR